LNLGRVVGRVVSTHKDPGLASRTILLIQPLAPDLSPAGRTIVALDAVGAGAGETILWVRGREASHAFLPDAVPVDAGVVGIVDETYVDERPGGVTR
jgi:microcompartment protein CcmK/EutM